MRFSIRRKNSCGGLRVAVFAAIMSLMSAMAFAGSSEEVEASSGFTARSVFEQLQSPALEILNRSARLDMLDYWDADSVYKAQNAMSGLSWLIDVKPDYLKVQVTPVSSLEIKILPVNKGKVVMTVYTVGGESQAADSQIDFYDTSLSMLDRRKFFKAPDLKAFFDIPKGSVTTMKEIREMVPFPTVEYSANGDNNNLSARLTVGEFMNVDDYNIVKLFLKPEVILRWNGKYK